MVAGSQELSEIRWRDSLFQPFPWRSVGEAIGPDSELVRSIAEIGLIEPVTVCTIQGEPHLVHGFRRFEALRILGKARIPAVVLGEERKRKAASLFFMARGAEIGESGAARACAFRMCRRIGLDHEDISHLFSSCLKVNLHSSIVRQLEEVASLPDQVLSFCHAKGFSLKKCHRLTSYRRELLEFVIDISLEIPLSASLFQESLHGLKRLCHVEGVSFSQLREELLQESILGNKNEGLSAKRYKDWLRKRCSPILMESNRSLELMAKELALPENMEISWDPTLERHELLISLKVREKGDFHAAARFFSCGDKEQILEKMLERL